MPKRYEVWDCKIVVEVDDLPLGFDQPPRRAAIKAVEDAGFTVLMCASGWGGTLSDSDKKYIEEGSDGGPDSGCYAGLPDTSTDAVN